MKETSETHTYTSLSLCNSNNKAVCFCRWQFFSLLPGNWWWLRLWSVLLRAIMRHTHTRTHSEWSRREQMCVCSHCSLSFICSHFHPFMCLYSSSLHLIFPPSLFLTRLIIYIFPYFSSCQNAWIQTSSECISVLCVNHSWIYLLWATL